MDKDNAHMIQKLQKLQKLLIFLSVSNFGDLAFTALHQIFSLSSKIHADVEINKCGFFFSHFCCDSMDSSLLKNRLIALIIILLSLPFHEVFVQIRPFHESFLQFFQDALVRSVQSPGQTS
jgi:hypothetical protein